MMTVEDDDLPRSEIAVQMARLNDNLEKQTRLIAQSMRRPIWALAIVMALLIVGVVRVEIINNSNEGRDKAQADRVDARSCRQTNLLRTQIQQSFANNYGVIIEAFRDDPDALAKVERIADRNAKDMATALPPLPCETGEAFGSCDEAYAAGAVPLRKGEPGYARALDADADGVACDP